jgi:HlyD family secretion protein
MSSLKKNLGSLILVLVVLGLGVVVTRTAIAGPQTTPREVDRVAAARVEVPPGQHVDTILERPEGDLVGGLGVVEPREPESRLSPAVPGRITRIAVSEGERVEAGTVLVEIESAIEEAQLAAAEADLAVAQASLARARRGVRVEELEAITRDADAAEARATLSQGVLERLERAGQSGAATGDEVERARRQADADRAALEAARARQQGGRSGRREDVLVAMAQVRVAEARRDQARATLDRLRIVAPIAGEVLEIRSRVGEYVQPSTTDAVVILGDTSELRARVDVDERDIARDGALDGVLELADVARPGVAARGARSAPRRRSPRCVCRSRGRSAGGRSRASTSTSLARSRRGGISSVTTLSR